MNSGNCIPLWDLLKRRDPVLAGVGRKPSQQESRRIDYILPVLDYAIKHDEFSARLLEMKLDVSRDSIDRTLNFLKRKNIVVLRRAGLRNEKFYTSRPREAKAYREYLIQWRLYKKFISKHKQTKDVRKNIAIYFKYLGKFGKTIRRAARSREFRAVFVPRDFLSTPFRLESELQQRRLTTIPWPQPITVRQMGFREARKIIRSYEEGRICKTCMRSRRLGVMHETPEGLELVCNQGHVSSIEY